MEEAPSWTLAGGLGGLASPHELTPGKRLSGRKPGPLLLGGHTAKLKMGIDLVSGKNTVLRGNFPPVINPLGN